MDLLIALSRFADSSCLLLTIDAIKDWFISREIHMQKKAYRCVVISYKFFFVLKHKRNVSNKIIFTFNLICLGFWARCTSVLATKVFTTFLP